MRSHTRNDVTTRSAAVPITASIYREALTRREEDAQRPPDFAALAQHCFRELNPLTSFAVSWHVEVITAKLAGVYHGQIRRLMRLAMTPGKVSTTPVVTSGGKSAFKELIGQLPPDGSSWPVLSARQMLIVTP